MFFRIGQHLFVSKPDPTDLKPFVDFVPIIETYAMYSDTTLQGSRMLDLQRAA